MSHTYNSTIHDISSVVSIREACTIAQFNAEYIYICVFYMDDIQKAFKYTYITYIVYLRVC